LDLKYFGTKCAEFTKKRTRTDPKGHLVCNISNTSKAAPLQAIAKNQRGKSAIIAALNICGNAAMSRQSGKIIAAPL
jgi:hypothetical protein